MDNITVPLAFGAGMISFFSPCIFPLIPAYVATLTGSYIKDDKMDVTKSIIMLRAVNFILGFSMIFMFMGASATVIGQLFSENKVMIEKISGIIISIFGLQMAGIIKLKFLMQEVRFQSRKTAKSGIWRSLLLGMAFAAGWTPCVGLALSSILLLAGSSETITSGIFLLFIYSIGLGIPFLLISLLLSYSLTFVKKINNKLEIISKVSGCILFLLGLLLLSGKLQEISAWLAVFTYL